MCIIYLSNRKDKACNSSSKTNRKKSSNLKQLQLISILNNGLKNSPIRNQETSVNIPQTPSNHIAAYVKLPVHTDFTFDYPSEELPPHQGTGFFLPVSVIRETALSRATAPCRVFPQQTVPRRGLYLIPTLTYRHASRVITE